MKRLLLKMLFVSLMFAISSGINAQSNFSVSLGLGSANLFHGRSHLLDNGNVITTAFDATSYGTHIVMLSPTGVKLWSKLYAATRIDDVKVLASGKIAFVGYRDSYNSVWGVLDASGNALWAKEYYSFDFNYDLASIDELANSHILYNFSKYSGSFTVRCDEEGEEDDCDNGNDSLSNGKNPSFDSFACDDSGYVECGKSDDRIILIRHDANGDVMWAKNYMKASTEYFHLKKIQQLTDGSFMGVGLVNDTYTGPNNSAFLIKFDANGEVIWSKKYSLPNNPGYFSSTFRTFIIEGNDIYASGYYSTDYLNLNHFIMHLDQNGDVISSKQMINTNNALNTVGMPTASSVTFDHDMNNHQLVYNNYNIEGAAEVEINKVNFDGVLGCTELDFPTIATSYTAFTGTAASTYTTISILETSPASILDVSMVVSTSNVVVTNSCAALAGVENEPAINFSVYPNPTSDVLNISGLNADGHYNIQMIDMTGKVVQINSGIEGVEFTSINVAGLSNGSYIIKVSDVNNSTFSQLKWMKM